MRYESVAGEAVRKRERERKRQEREERERYIERDLAKPDILAIEFSK